MFLFEKIRAADFKKLLNAIYNVENSMCRIDFKHLN